MAGPPIISAPPAICCSLLFLCAASYAFLHLRGPIDFGVLGVKAFQRGLAWVRRILHNSLFQALASLNNAPLLHTLHLDLSNTGIGGVLWGAGPCQSERRAVRPKEVVEALQATTGFKLQAKGSKLSVCEGGGGGIVHHHAFICVWPRLECTH